MLTVNNRTYGLAHIIALLVLVLCVVLYFTGSANVLIALGLIAALALALLLG
jgi:hypothetical protein